MILKLYRFYCTAFCGQDCAEDIGLYIYILIASCIGRYIHLNLNRVVILCNRCSFFGDGLCFFLLNHLRFLYRKENCLNKISCRNYYYT